MKTTKYARLIASAPDLLAAWENLKLRDGATERRRLQRKRNRAVLCSAWFERLVNDLQTIGRNAKIILA